MEWVGWGTERVAMMAVGRAGSGGKSSRPSIVER
jgi:hypothetical protein